MINAQVKRSYVTSSQVRETEYRVGDVVDYLGEPRHIAKIIVTAFDPPVAPPFIEVEFEEQDTYDLTEFEKSPTLAYLDENG